MDYTQTVENTKAYIKAHISEDLSAQSIADEEGYSVFHFCRIFKETTGQSLMQYVRQKRLEKAQTEISCGSTASTAAINCGFETASGFSRAYKRTFGYRPAANIDT